MVGRVLLALSLLLVAGCGSADLQESLDGSVVAAGDDVESSLYSDITKDDYFEAAQEMVDCLGRAGFEAEVVELDTQFGIDVFGVGDPDVAYERCSDEVDYMAIEMAYVQHVLKPVPASEQAAIRTGCAFELGLIAEPSEEMFVELLASDVEQAAMDELFRCIDGRIYQGAE